MKFILSVLWLTGIVSSLDFPLEYEYVYQGTTFLGIPAIKSQYAGVGIKANVTIQTKSANEAIIQLSAIETGEENGEVQPSEASRIFNYEIPPYLEYMDILKKPFGVYFEGSNQGAVMIVPENDIEFITNIRKAIAEQFRVFPHLTQSDEVDRVLNENLIYPTLNNNSIAFTVTESSLFGQCESFYTIYQINETLALKKPYTNYKHDAGSKFFNVTRSINFDSCPDLVTLKHTSMSNFVNAGKSKFESIQGRSSIGRYIFQRKNEQWRLVDSFVEGQVVLNPFGFESEKMMSLSTKTMNLISVKKITNPIPLPSASETKRIFTWGYAVASTHQPSFNARPWVNYYDKNKYQFTISESYLTGVNTDVLDIHNRCVLALSSLIQKAIFIITSNPLTSQASNVSPWETVGAMDATLLMEAGKVVRVFLESEIEQLFKKNDHIEIEHQSLYRDLLVDVLASSGSSASIRVLLKKIQGGEIGDARAASIFMTLTNQFFNPNIMLEIMEFLMQMNYQTHPLMYSAGFVNFASLVRKICLDQDTSSSSVAWPLYGDGNVCNASFVKDLAMFDYLLEVKLENSNSTLEKTVIMQTLSNLGLPTSLAIFENVTKNSVKYDITIRCIAVYAMEMVKIQESHKEEAFAILMRIFQDVRFEDEIRQAAFITMLTWSPGPAWWQSVAKGTWNEHSLQLSSLISFTIQSLSRATSSLLAEQAKIASFVLRLAKPVPATFRHSYNYIFAKYLNQQKTDTNFHFEWLPNMESNIPSEVYAHLTTSFGGFEFNLFEIVLSSYGFDGMEFQDLFRMDFGRDQSSSINQFKKFFQLVEGIRKAESSTVHHRQRVDLLFRAFDNMYSYSTLNFAELFAKNSEHKGTVAKYFNAINSEIFFPTELGLPLVTEATLSFVIYSDFKSYFNASQVNTSSTNFVLQTNIEVETDLRMVTKLLPRMKVLVPWSRRTIMVGVDNVKRLHLPMVTKFGLSLSNASSSVLLSVSPTPKTKLTVAYAHNVPFTGLKPLFPGRNLPEESDMRVILKRKSPAIQKNSKFGLREFGFDLSLEFEGDMDYPFTSAKFMDMIRNPASLTSLLASPSAAFWKTSIELHPLTSTSKTAALAVSVAHPVRIVEENMDEEPISKVDCRYLVDASISDTMDLLKDRTVKIRSYLGKPATTQYLEYSATRFLVGPKTCIEDMILTSWDSQPYSISRSAVKSTIFYARFTNDSIGDVLLFVGHADVPSVKDYETFTKLVETKQMFVNGSGMFSTWNPEKVIASYQSSLSLSDQRSEQILDDIQHGCLKGTDSPLIDLHTILEYDEAELTIKIENPTLVTPTMKNLTYKLENYIHGAYYPAVYTNGLDLKNPADQFTISAKRTFASPDYHLRIQSPDEDIEVYNFQIPFGFNKLVSYAVIDNQVAKDTKEIQLKEAEDYSCHIWRNKVRTFDGLEIKFPATPCQIISVFDVTTKYDWIITYSLNNNSQLELKLYADDRYLVLQMTNDSIMVDQQKIDVTSDAPIRQFYDNDLGHVYLIISLIVDETKRTSYYRAVIPHVATLEMLHDSIRIIPEMRMREVLRGICGNFDGRPENDNIGSRRCLYDTNKQALTYGVSWLDTDLATNACYRDYTMSVALNQLTQFRKTCRKQPIE